MVVQIEKVPLTISNLYSELFQQVLAGEAERGVGHLDATIISKKVKGKSYYYYQYYQATVKKQIYLGGESKEMKTFLKEFEQKKGEIQSDLDVRKQIVSSIQNSFPHKFDHISSKLVKLFHDAGLFKLGAVLVGTYAFLSYSYLLGVRWRSQTQTQDIDIAQDKSLGIALSREFETIEMPDVLEKARMGFFPVPDLNPKHPSTSFKIRGKEMKVDFLTVLRGKPSSEPINLLSLKTAATPLRYMDLLLDHFIQVALPVDSGILVNVPDPSFFALHKLIVAEKRPVTESVKKRKDLLQAENVLRVLKEEQSDYLNAAYSKIIKCYPETKKIIDKYLKKFKMKL